MAMRLGMLKRAADDARRRLEARRWTHVAAMPPLIDGAVDLSVAPPPLVLPEFDHKNRVYRDGKDIGFGFSGFAFGGSMDLMAVPKKKVSPHKRGIRNGPKALKPTPVIIRCKSCGRVKLPHFYCCSGDRGKPDEQNESNN